MELLDMADSKLSFLVVRGHRYVHVEGSTWRSWCRICGAEYLARSSSGRFQMPMKCPAHKNTEVDPYMPRHPNASAWGENLMWRDAEGKSWLAPAVRMSMPFGLHVRIPNGEPLDPDLRQPSYAPNAVRPPAAPRRAEIEEPDSDT